MPKEKKTSATKGDKNEKLVLDYLIKQNRPLPMPLFISAIDVFLHEADIVANLHNEVSKTDCQKIVSSLVDKDLVTTKLYGKQAIYVVRQDTIDTASPDQLAAIDREITQLQNNISEYKTRNKQLSFELNLVNSALTTEQINERLKTLASKNDKASQALEMLRSGNKPVTPEAKKKVMKEMEYHRKLWRDRKRTEELDINMTDPIDIGTDPRELLQT
ncbi:hypothetical protein BG004_007446 [Podila humilis]|nr:hypothetical protein BG004_007446 [Podila humilis]